MPFSAMWGLLLLAGLYSQLAGSKDKYPEEEGASKPDPQDPEIPTCQQIYRSIADVFLNLYRNPKFWPTDTNILLSPVSITAAVATLSLGTSADTQTQVMKALGLNPQKVAKAQLYQCLQQLPYIYHQPDIQLQLTAGSHLLTDHTLTPIRPFAGSTKLSHSEPIAMNFKDPEWAQQQISNYVEKETQREIMGLAKALTTEKDSLILNHMTFRGKLHDKFDTVSIAEENFYVNENITVKVPTLYSWSTFHMQRDELLSSWVLVQFYVGNITAFFLLPDHGKMQRLMEQITPEHLDDIRSFTDIKYYHIHFPKLNSITVSDLKSYEESLGLPNLFNKTVLSSAKEQRTIKNQKVVQQAVLTVDENGTEFAASTDTLVHYSYRDRTVRFNRPFVIVLGTSKDDDIFFPLFMGKVANPIKY
ncbi:alpha-1-antitrypsin-related protein-like [Lepus europaeus]|uniref:alpha-1-antitrypsin-related protein-like n=1 Tax=Lepus europaeus TaxID=9983 RepID=UPI002B45E6FE|nr:alpha-1-antitrypsin-related protein-like [Lepus europaeus]